MTLFKLNQLLIENDDESLQSQSEEPEEEEMIEAEGADAADKLAEREARRGGQKYVRLPSSTFSIKVSLRRKKERERQRNNIMKSGF